MDTLNLSENKGHYLHKELAWIKEARILQSVLLVYDTVPTQEIIVFSELKMILEITCFNIVVYSRKQVLKGHNKIQIFSSVMGRLVYSDDFLVSPDFMLSYRHQKLSSFEKP